MRKAELLKTAKQKLAIRNYSKRTIESYWSAVNHFANWLIQEKITTVDDRIVEKYLFEESTPKRSNLVQLCNVVRTFLSAHRQTGMSVVRFK